MGQCIKSSAVSKFFLFSLLFALINLMGVAMGTVDSNAPVLLIPFEQDDQIRTKKAVNNEDSATELCAMQVLIYPKTGKKYEAIIKDKSVLSKFKKDRHLDLSQFKSKDMVTLYYMGGMNGSMGICLNDVKDIVAVMALTKQDFDDVQKAIGRRIQKLEKEEEVRLVELKKKNELHKKEMKETALRKQQQKLEEARKKAEANAFPLLLRFPPSKGWGKAMKEELERRRIVLSVFPKPEEQAFLDYYEEWAKQYEAWKVLQEKEGHTNKGKGSSSSKNKG